MKEIILSAKKFFANAGFDWSICGGGAIDICLGNKTRTHKDLDLAVYWEDRKAIIAYMLNSGWRVFEACGGGIIHELFTVDSSEKRNLFCFTNNETRCYLEPIGSNKYRFTFINEEQLAFSYVEFLFNFRDDKFFYYTGNSSIKRSIEKAVILKDGYSILAPEIVLLYKSTYLEGNDSNDHLHDFNLSVPHLDLEQKQWLKQALEVVHLNNHQWIQKL
ncbi:hypothetical protein SAMN05661091_2649 [Paenibacillus uliginis N3/975]|uniref:Aminoglycoside-2''-adenylyltransferase n=1 Tax=Paenibacillus uliginis N3/975 TaxID=1313296 RepID=A0A1X7HEV4_9BACL|nr:hypothetical protein [Paenibacillus uliginis]SMF84553.1 hypothetical protein SAMN05661091_2649 [Paenibacillus uliginis N3/975]